ncbi:MAG: hypothetical protein VKM17_08195 [Cyanobacteriota bacterium]|nr:hypothetical protein [Cyanobacteriota bacterium]
MLTPEDLDLLEASLLPAMERHYLRLLAHGLRTLQTIAASTADPQRAPDRAQMVAWAASQAPMADDPHFRDAFLDQLERLMGPLEEMASRGQQPLLTLQMSQLLAWVKEQADARLSSPSQPPG